MIESIDKKKGDNIRVMTPEELKKGKKPGQYITQAEAGTATGDKGEGKLVEKTKEELAIEAEVKAKTAETRRIEAERQAKLKADRIADKNVKADIKETARLKKQSGIDDARDYYGSDVVLTQERLDKFLGMSTEQREGLEGIFEEDDPEPVVDAYNRNKDLNYNTPQNQATSTEETDQNTATTRTREQKENDKIYNDFRTSKYKKKKMIEGGYNPIQSKSPAQMRDDRIYTNALKGGPVRKNMIKGGYTPKN